MTPIPGCLDQIATALHSAAATLTRARRIDHLGRSETARLAAETSRRIAVLPGLTGCDRSNLVDPHSR